MEWLPFYESLPAHVRARSTTRPPSCVTWTRLPPRAHTPALPHATRGIVRLTRPAWSRTSCGAQGPTGVRGCSTIPVVPRSGVPVTRRPRWRRVYARTHRVLALIRERHGL